MVAGGNDVVATDPDISLTVEKLKNGSALIEQFHTPSYSHVSRLGAWGSHFSVPVIVVLVCLHYLHYMVYVHLGTLAVPLKAPPCTACLKVILPLHL